MVNSNPIIGVSCKLAFCLFYIRQILKKLKITYQLFSNYLTYRYLGAWGGTYLGTQI